MNIPENMACKGLNIYVLDTITLTSFRPYSSQNENARSCMCLLRYSCAQDLLTLSYLHSQPSIQCINIEVNTCVQKI